MTVCECTNDCHLCQKCDVAVTVVDADVLHTIYNGLAQGLLENDAAQRITTSTVS